MNATVNRAVGAAVNLSAVGASTDEVTWHTTEASLTEEEEDAIVTLVVVLGVIAAIVVLFSMGIFIDCRHQKKDCTPTKRLRLKMPPVGRRRNLPEDVNSLASDMCPNGNSEIGGRTDTTDAVV